MKTCVAAACGIFILLASCSGSGEFKPSFNQPLQPVMQPGFVYVDQVAPLVKTNLKYAGYDNFVGVRWTATTAGAPSCAPRRRTP